jgi:hypothetical protein
MRAGSLLKERKRMIERTKVEQVIGKTYADKLDEAIFRVGNWEYTRREMVDDLGCASFIAATRLAKVLRRLNVMSPAQLNRLDPSSLARTKGIGESSLFVAMCILDHAQYNILDWWGMKDNVVKFSTFKHNVIRRARKHKQEVA